MFTLVKLIARTYAENNFSKFNDVMLKTLISYASPFIATLKAAPNLSNYPFYPVCTLEVGKATT